MRVQQRVLTDIVMSRLCPQIPRRTASPQVLRLWYPPASDWALLLQQYLGGNVPPLLLQTELAHSCRHMGGGMVAERKDVWSSGHAAAGAVSLPGSSWIGSACRRAAIGSM